VATCTQYFYAEDDAGNSLPVTIDATISKYTAEGWVPDGVVSISPGGLGSRTLVSGNSYKALPVTIPSGYETPSEQIFTACDRDVKFVYERICPDPTVSITSVSNYNPASGETVNFEGYASGGTGESIKSVRWDFGDGTSSTALNPSKAWTNTTGSPVTYTVTFTATNDCRKSKSSSTTITVASAIVETGFKIQLAPSLSGKQLIVWHAVKFPFIGLVGPDPNLWFSAFGWVRGSWNSPASGTYKVEVGDIRETATPPFDEVHLGTLLDGQLHDGDDCVVLARESPSVMGFGVFKGEDIFKIHSDSVTEINLTTASSDVITEAIMGPTCDFFKIPRGPECEAFWAEFSDHVFVANYISILTTGKDTLGNARTLGFFDHIALPFAMIGVVVPAVPFNRFFSQGLRGLWRGAKPFSDAAVTWMGTVVVNVPESRLAAMGDWNFMQAIVRIDAGGVGGHMDEIMDLVADERFTEALAKLEGYLDTDTPLSYWDWKVFNDALRKAVGDAEFSWLMDTIHATKATADSVLDVAKKSSWSADDIAKINDAATNPNIVKAASDAISNSLRTADEIADPVVRATKLGELENIAESFPQAFDEIAKKPIAEVGALVKRSSCETLGVKTTKANKQLITYCFKKRFDNVLPYSLTKVECDGIIWMVNQDPIAAAKAFDDYTDLADKERLLLSLKQSGTDGRLTASWLSAAKTNIDLDGVYDLYGMNVHEVMNHVSQAGNYALGGIYDNLGVKAMDDAATRIPSFTHVEDVNKFIQEVSDTVRISSVGDNAAKIAQDAIDDNPRSISQIFQNAGVDVIRSDALGNGIYDVSEFIEVLGDHVNSGDVTKIVARIIEDDIVANKIVIRNTINRIVGDGAISDDGLQAIFDIRNQSPEAWKRVMKTIPADVVATLNNIMDSSGKGRAFIQLEDLYNVFRSKMDSAYGATVGEAAARFRYRTAPLALRYDRATGGSGFFNSFARHGGLKGILRSKYVLAYMAASMGVTAGTAVVFWYLFEWSPIRYGLQKAGRLPLPIADWFGNVKNDSTFTTAEFRKTTDSAMYQNLMIEVAGKLCELVDYGNKNPVINDDKWQELVDGWNFYFGIGQGPTTTSMHEEMVDTLETHLKTYNEWITNCVNDGECVSGAPLCITADMIWAERAGKTYALSSAAEYKTILDATWACVPELPETGSVFCTVTSSMGHDAIVTDAYGVKLGTITNASGFWVTGLALNIDHVLKIVKDGNYTECAETFRFTEADPEQAFPCDINCTDWVDTVTIATTMEDGSPAVDIQPGDTLKFIGAATSARVITDWLWNFNDPHCPTADNTSTLQNPSHRYEGAGIFPVTLTATNVCGNPKAGDAEVWVVGEEPAPPGVESATIDVLLPIDSQTGKTIVWPVEVHIFVDNQTIDEKARYAIPFGGFGELPVRDPTKVTVKATGYQDKSETFHLYDGFSETWQPYMDPVGYVPPVDKFAINFYIPDGASLTTTKITTVSRIVTGMRRIQGR